MIRECIPIQGQGWGKGMKRMRTRFTQDRKRKADIPVLLYPRFTAVVDADDVIEQRGGKEARTARP